MAKIISYKLLSCEINRGTEAEPNIELVLLDKKIMCPTEFSYNANLLIAQKEAYNGEYTVEDDGQPEPETPQTQEQRIAELEEALDMLLNGVTE